MVVSRQDYNILSNEVGQSLLEFALVLPVVIGLAVVMVRVSSAIQVSIVNQKYSRMQALWYTFNHTYFPPQRGEGFLQSNFIEPKYNRMTIGVSEEPLDASAGVTKASATIQSIRRDKTKIVSGDNNNAQEEPAQRSQVRVRTTVSICTAPFVVDGSGAYARSIASSNGKSVDQASQSYADGMRIDFCRGQSEQQLSGGEG